MVGSFEPILEANTDDLIQQTDKIDELDESDPASDDIDNGSKIQNEGSIKKLLYFI